MIIRVLILLIAVVLHILTPRWFLNDFLTVADWLMMAFGLCSVIVNKLSSKDKWQRFLSLLLSINAMIYFVSTAQILVPDVGLDRAAYRLLVIFKSSYSGPSKNIGSVLEMFNLIQLFVGILISILLILKLYRVKKSVFAKLK